MLELSRQGEGWKLGYGGDTLNTAIHLARAGHEVAYLTALGIDPFSDQLRGEWSREGLDTSLVLADPDRNPGLYAISTDPRGERSFTYWRGESAARGMFALPGIDEIAERAASADLLVFSLISLAILPEEGRERLLGLARDVRTNGGRVAFDGNWRPGLWEGQEAARRWRDEAIACADFGFPTLEDEESLSGIATASAAMLHWQLLGCRETVVKLGADGCRLPDGRCVKPPELLSPVDTSGAGDAFNAGYLEARLAGASEADAALAGHRTAGWTIMRRGAIPPASS